MNRASNVHPLKRRELEPVTTFSSGCDYLGGSGAGLRNHNVVPQSTVPAALDEAEIDGLPKRRTDRAEARSAVADIQPMPKPAAPPKVQPKMDLESVGYWAVWITGVVILACLAFAHFRPVLQPFAAGIVLRALAYMQGFSL